jgi:hypothetical protein
MPILLIENVLAGRTAAGAAGADPQVALAAAGIQRVAPVDGVPAGRTVIAVKSKAAAAAIIPVRIPVLGKDMRGAADKTDRRQLRIGPNALTVASILIEELNGFLWVECFHS